MFFVDFVTFVYLASFYSELTGNPNTNLLSSIQRNQVPVSYFLTIFSQFMLLVLDRIICRFRLTISITFLTVWGSTQT